MTLEDMSPAAFGLFVNWLYTSQLADVEGKSAPLEDLLDLWLFADKALVPSLQNQTIDAINTLPNKVHTLGKQNFVKIWENTSKDSKLRSYLQGQLEQSAVELHTADNFPHELLWEILTQMRDQVPLMYWESNLELKPHMMKEFHVVRK